MVYRFVLCMVDEGTRMIVPRWGKNWRLYCTVPDVQKQKQEEGIGITIQPWSTQIPEGAMNATAHMAFNGNVGDEYIPGFAGPKSKKKAKAMDEFIERRAQSFEQ